MAVQGRRERWAQAVGDTLGGVEQGVVRLREAWDPERLPGDPGSVRERAREVAALASRLEELLQQADMLEPEQPDRGREASRPTRIPLAGWRDVLVRVKESMRADQVPLLAAGVAFYGMLAFVPALIALILLYGLVAEPADVGRQLQQLTSILPVSARDILRQQLTSIVGGADRQLTVGLIVSVVAVVFVASSGMQALISGVNRAVQEKETRGLVRMRVLAVLLTLGTLLFTVVTFLVIVAAPAVTARLPARGLLMTLLSLARWPVLAVIVMTGLAVLYRYGPNRARPRWRWASQGAIVATVLWLAGSVVFSAYVGTFGRFNRVYGSLGAVMVLMLWLYLSAFAVLVGAQLNGHLELQTRRDSTTGPDRPMGERQAFAADHVEHA